MEEEVVVPGGAPEFCAHGVFGGFAAWDVECEAPEQGEVFGFVLFAVSLPVLVHGHMEHPVQAVFDDPMDAHGVLEVLGRKRRVCDVVVVGFGFRAFSGYAFRLDLADRGQSWRAQPCNLVADRGAAGLDAPVIAVKGDRRA